MSEIADVCREIDEAYADVIALLHRAMPRSVAQLRFMDMGEEAYRPAPEEGKTLKESRKHGREIHVTCEHPRTVLTLYADSTALYEFRPQAGTTQRLIVQKNIGVQDMLERGSKVMHKEIERYNAFGYGFRYCNAKDYYVMADPKYATEPLQQQITLLKAIGEYAKGERFIDQAQAKEVIDRAVAAVRAADTKLPAPGEEVAIAKGEAPGLTALMGNHIENPNMVKIDVTPEQYENEKVVVSLGTLSIRVSEAQKLHDVIKREIKEIAPQAVFSTENIREKEGKESGNRYEAFDPVVTLPAHVYEQAFGGTGLEGLKHAPSTGASKGGGRGGRGGKR